MTSHPRSTNDGQGPAFAARRLSKVVILGNHPPRQCGIATFTSDLAHAISGADAGLVVDCIAMNDRLGYSYPRRVRYEIAADDPAEYRRAADFINDGGYDVLSIQHEYGIFGGEAGRYLLNLVRKVRIPIVTTLHTVLLMPSRAQKEVMGELLEHSSRIAVMSKRAAEFLAEVHDVPNSKVDLNNHGIPDVQESVGRAFRAKIGIDGPMILTFGFLSPDKGIEYAIAAMPKIVRVCPGATYCVVGTTHPNVRASVGEVYRESLEKLANALGVTANVRFIDRYVDIEELIAFLGAMDFYITPYLNPHQITSGTLAYAIGAGKAVISTPYWYAEELLDEGRGVLVPFCDAQGIADAILALVRLPKIRLEMGRRAAAYGSRMRWPEVGRGYLTSFAKCLARAPLAVGGR